MKPCHLCEGRSNLPSGDEIRRARLSAGMKQDELAEAIGVNRCTISEWERETKKPTGEKWRAICEACDVDPVLGVADQVKVEDRWVIQLEPGAYADWIDGVQVNTEKLSDAHAFDVKERAEDALLTITRKRGRLPRAMVRRMEKVTRWVIM